MKKLTKDDLKVGKVYRAKRFREGFFGTNNDRIILWIGASSVQYDSDTVKDGRRYPTTSIESFLNWAAREAPSER